MCTFQLEIGKNKKGITKEHFTNLYEMNVGVKFGLKWFADATELLDKAVEYDRSTPFTMC